MTRPATPACASCAADRAPRPRDRPPAWSGTLPRPSVSRTTSGVSPGSRRRASGHDATGQRQPRGEGRHAADRQLGQVPARPATLRVGASASCAAWAAERDQADAVALLVGVDQQREDGGLRRAASAPAHPSSGSRRRRTGSRCRAGRVRTFTRRSLGADDQRLASGPPSSVLPGRSRAQGGVERRVDARGPSESRLARKGRGGRQRWSHLVAQQSPRRRDAVLRRPSRDHAGLAKPAARAGRQARKRRSIRLVSPSPVGTRGLAGARPGDLASRARGRREGLTGATRSGRRCRAVPGAGGAG